jgi:hypothetical protein
MQASSLLIPAGETPAPQFHNSILQAFHVSAVKAPKTLRGRSTKPGGAGE